MKKKHFLKKFGIWLKKLKVSKNLFLNTDLNVVCEKLTTKKYSING